MTDAFGYPITCSPEAAIHWDRTVFAFLAHGADTPVHLGAALETAPGFAMGHAAKALLYLMLGRSELDVVAREAATSARNALTGGATPRETLFVEAAEDWVAGAPSAAIAKMEAVMAAWPRDAFAMKVGHAIRFILGDAPGMRRSLDAVAHAYDTDHPARGYFDGCRAFALEETGDYAGARAAGEAGLARAADDAWGLHAVAHVHDMTGASAEGIAWLTGREAAWAHCNNFRFHVWWHKALMHLDQGQVDTVLHLYDTEIRAEKTDDWRDISNGASLLMRLELEGVATGKRWEELAEIAATRTEDGCMVFADLHYMLALAGGRREDSVAKLMGRMERDATRLNCETDHRMARPGVAAATGCAAFAEGDHTAAFLNLRRARPVLRLAGGSHAQRDVFERMTIDAGIRSGFLSEAEGMLSERTAQRAGREDAYAAARRGMIAAARRAMVAEPAE